MEVLSILFESRDILKKQAKEIEKRNIISLQQTDSEIKKLLEKVPTPKKHKIIYVKDNSSYRHVNNFPVDYRTVKS